jgi:protease-4
MHRIALLPIKGVIISEETSLPAMRVISSVEIIRLLEGIKKSKAIKALVLEINSPGGTPFPCQEIAEAVKSLGKPTVAWVREMAASGGYWIASSADVIVADSLSTVGSVGVTSIRPDFSELLKKIGIDMNVMASGIQKLFGVPFEPPSEEEKQRREEEVKLIQHSFMQGIKENRDLKEEVIKEISSGKTYFGQEAKALGLIDELGGKEKAFEIAAKRADIKAYKLLDYTKKLKRPKKGLLARLLESF